MAARLTELFSGASARARILIVLGAIGVFGIVIYFGTRYLTGGDATTAAASVANAPGSLQSVPGGQLTPEYYRALSQANTQAAQQAQMTGASSVPTLINVPGQVPTANCTVQCPSPDNADVTNGINDLVKQGKLTQAEATQLIDLAKSNVPVESYAARLSELVKQGKLTPEQARKILAEYSLQHANAGAATGAQAIDALVRAGQVPLEVANDLVALQKLGANPAMYEQVLKNMVDDGRITPQTAAQLLGQFTRQKEDEATKASVDELQRMAQSGQISKEAADSLTRLQQQAVPLNTYEAELNRLVAAGKMTPATAATLLKKYKDRRTAIGPAQELKGIAAAADKAFADGIEQGVASGGITRETADTLLGLQNPAKPMADYKASLDQLVRDGKLTQAEADDLLNASANGMSEEAYQQKLNDLVKAGKLTEAQAAALLANHKKIKATPMGQATTEYRQSLDKLVGEGKLSAAEADELLAASKAGESDADYKKRLDSLVKAGKLTQQQAAALLAQHQKLKASAKAPTVAEYQKKLEELVRTGKLTARQATGILAAYKAAEGSKALAERLNNLQANKASLTAYADELKKAVQDGIIPPEMAASLLRSYQQALAVPQIPTGGTGPAIQTNIPGGEEFAQLQQRLQDSSVTATPTPDLGTAPGTTTTTTTTTGGASAFEAAQAKALAEAAKAKQQRLQELMNAMSAQAKELITAWTPPKMEHKDGTPEDKKDGLLNKDGTATKTTTTTTTDKKDAAAEPTGPILVKAGTILFGVLTTAVNSDYPDTPVMATVVSGPLKGAVLLGKLNLAKDQDKVSLVFNLMNRDDWDKAKSINAFAIDPDTARTVLATNVNHHYMLRYGTLFASSFLQGYSSGITNAGQSTTGIFGTSTTHPNLSPGNRIAVALGQVGTTFSKTVADYVNTPTTVEVKAGVGIGLLFMADVT